jgi:ParB family chromosome partitioning protein
MFRDSYIKFLTPCVIECFGGGNQLDGATVMGGRSSHQGLEPLTIPINRVRCGESHMRRSGFYVESLKSTIQDTGLLQPILARRTGTSDFTVIDGARRLAALIELGVTELIVGRDLIIDVEETEADARFKQIIANVQREDFNAIELGHAFVTLKEEYGYQYNEISEIVGKTPHYVTAKVGLAKRLEHEVQQLYIEDLEREKCIQNTFSADAVAVPGYVMNVNVLEDIARLAPGLQKTAYVAVRAGEMDKGRALRYLRSLKKQAMTAEAAETFAGVEKQRYCSLHRHIGKIGRDIERLVDTVSCGDVMDREAALPEIEKLIEKLNSLYIRIKIKDADVAEGVHG